MENFKALYTPAEIAKILFDGKISVGCIRVKADAGEIPCTRFGRKIFIPGIWLKEQLEYGLGSGNAEKAIAIEN